MAPYRERRSADKDANNRAFVALVARHWGARCTPLRALVLDGKSMRTSRAVAAAFRKRVEVTVPQLDPDSVPPMRRNAPPEGHVRVVPGSMAALLQSCEGTVMHAAYFDYMGAVTGNRTKDLLPLEDIWAFLKANAARSGPVVLCCTFSARMHRGLIRGRASAQQQIVDDYLKPLFRYQRFAVLDLASRTYKRCGTSGPMVFVQTVLQYDATIDASDVAFIASLDQRHYEGYRERIRGPLFDV